MGRWVYDGGGLSASKRPNSKNYSFRSAVAWSWYAAVAKGPVIVIKFMYAKLGAYC